MTDDLERVATCSCGQLRVTASGDPDVVVACSCFECQRRTGSPFGVSAYFQRQRVRWNDGAHKSYRRGTDSGQTFDEFLPGVRHVGVLGAGHAPRTHRSRRRLFRRPAIPRTGEGGLG